MPKEKATQFLCVGERHNSKWNLFKTARTTANWTGEIKSIGGSKTISSGGFKIDRDVNGAAGIMLKALLLAQPSAQVGAFNTLGN
jgi:hypothetical protein